MELRALNRFVTVAEELHFGRAAERLHIAESALSRHIQKLEEDLQFDLFNRTNRRVQLTPAGVVFLKQSRSLTAAFRLAVSAARRTAEGKSGFIRVGFVSAALCELIPPVLRSFQKQWPDVELGLFEMSTGQQLHGLLENRIDIGFVRDPILTEPKEFVFESVVRENIAVAVPRNHPLARRSCIHPKTLAKESFIIYPFSEPMSNWEKLVRNICRKAGFEPHVTQRTMQIHTAISLVSAGIGIAMVPISARSVRQKGVAYRPLEERAVTELVVVHRNEKISQVLRNFLTSTREVVGEINEPARRSKKHPVTDK
jgi:DNA-binding transcriptional LysR family regulator